MTRKRKHDVKGTNDFLIWAVVLFALGIWAVRDGWYPSQAKQEKYPQRVPIAFETTGAVSEVLVRPGQEVKAGETLARLDDTVVRRDLVEAEAALEAAASDPEGDRETLVRLRRQVESIQKTQLQHELRAPESGLIREVHISPRDEAEVEAPAVILDPRHHFYPFNKSLAVLSLIGAVVCLGIHFKVR